ncbi:hypothetical protein MOQ67_01245 [Pseudomonas sp. LY-1]
MSFFQNVALQPGESLNSLLMRKAELNGYGCAQALLSERGLKLTVAYSSPELAQICECFELNEEQLNTTRIGQMHYLGQPSYLRNVRIPRHPATQSTNIRPPVPRSSGQAVGAQRRRFALLV